MEVAVSRETWNAVKFMKWNSKGDFSTHKIFVQGEKAGQKQVIKTGVRGSGLDNEPLYEMAGNTHICTVMLLSR